MQAILDKSYNTIAFIFLAGGTLGSTSSSGFLTVWISTGTNFSTTGVKCSQGVGIIAGRDGYVTCPQMNGVNYVTAVRNDPYGRTDNLVLYEMSVFFQCEF